MKPTHALLAHAVIASIAITGLAIAQNQQEDTKAPENQPGQRPTDIGAFQMILGDKKMDDAAAMAQWMEIGKPGEPHKLLANMKGQWNATMRMWMDPSQPPMESKGQATFEPVMGGRFMQQKLAIAMMGMPYEGLGYTGFDNHRRMFIGTWMDSMSTSISFSKGSINPAGDQITMFTEMDEPSTGEIGKVAKFVTRFENDDTFVFEAWEVMYGEPWKVFEIEYNRKAAKQPTQPANDQ